MNCKILHETHGRMRVRMLLKRMTGAQADRLHYYLLAQEGVMKVTVSERTMDATILFEPGVEGARDAVVTALASFDLAQSPVDVPDHTGRELNRDFEYKLFFLVARRAACMFVLPPILRNLVCLTSAVHYFGSALKCLQRGKLEVPVLDATTISVSILRGNWSTAGSVMFLLDAGSLLEEWTHKKSVDDLARRMYINVDSAWVKTENAEEVLVPISKIAPDDHIIVRTGNVIPLDGVVVAGEGAVNQASMTGESLPVRKEAGAYVYAGTVLEEGELEICVKKALGSGRYDKIIHMIEESEKLKSSTEARAAHLADSLVPWSLGGSAAAWLLTRNARSSPLCANAVITTLM